ncbi:MAG: hypothetical protein ABFD83_02450 [Armatimonadota bacterium]
MKARNKEKLERTYWIEIRGFCFARDQISRAIKEDTLIRQSWRYVLQAI